MSLKLNFYSENNDNKYFINIIFIQNKYCNNEYLTPYIQFINIDYNFTYKDELYENNINIHINYRIVSNNHTIHDNFISYPLTFKEFQNQIVPYILYHKYLKDNNQNLINNSQLNDTKNN